MSYRVNWEIRAIDLTAGFFAMIPSASARSGNASVS
jgi:hypothetical protein